MVTCNFTLNIDFAKLLDMNDEFKKFQDEFHFPEVSIPISFKK